jgi:hypothetical protein
MISISIIMIKTDPFVKNIRYENLIISDGHIEEEVICNSIEEALNNAESKSKAILRRSDRTVRKEGTMRILRLYSTIS